MSCKSLKISNVKFNVKIKPASAMLFSSQACFKELYKPILSWEPQIPSSNRALTRVCLSMNKITRAIFNLGS